MSNDSKWALVIDIETAPSDDAWVWERLTADVGPPGNMSKAETIARWNAEQRPAKEAQAMERGALSGTYGQITAIGWKFHPGGPVEVRARRARDTENALLRDFFAAVRKQIKSNRDVRPAWTGYNIAGFDLRFLYQRAIATGTEMRVGLPYDAPPWSKDCIDLMQWWCGTRDRVRKEDAARAMGLEVPEDAISGAEMPGLWLAGEYEAIARHVRQDVELTAAMLDIYLRTTA